MGRISQQYRSSHILLLLLLLRCTSLLTVTIATDMPRIQRLPTPQPHSQHPRQSGTFQRRQELLVPSILPQLLGQFPTLLLGLLRRERSPRIRTLHRGREIDLKHLFVVGRIIVGALAGGAGGIVTRVALRGGAAGKANAADAGDVGASHEAGDAGVFRRVLFLLLTFRGVVGGVGDVVSYLGIDPVGADQQGCGDERSVFEL
mmetsp:Transcript_6584/g.14590  ORF Transcript_6584/g.14590 Transcript_6584/m.14590 type:complete len:203 (-) Transcript_6584:1791-2399(-)